jgi:hypothetical protein
VKYSLLHITSCMSDELARPTALRTHFSRISTAKPDKQHQPNKKHTTHTLELLLSTHRHTPYMLGSACYCCANGPASCSSLWLLLLQGCLCCCTEGAEQPHCRLALPLSTGLHLRAVPPQDCQIFLSCSVLTIS